MGWVGPSRRAHAMPWLLARHSTAPTREYYAVIQRAQCWWATTCGCRDEESNPGPPGSETSALPLGHRPSLGMFRWMHCVNFDAKTCMWFLRMRNFWCDYSLRKWTTNPVQVKCRNVELRNFLLKNRQITEMKIAEIFCLLLELVHD